MTLRSGSSRLCLLALGALACGACRSATASPDAGPGDASLDLVFPDAGARDVGTDQDPELGPPCEVEDAIVERPCGERCGMALWTCRDGFWDVGPCLNEGECKPGEARGLPGTCGLCGEVVGVCSSACRFEPAGCRNEGECEPGQLFAVERGACAEGEANVRRCDDTCAVRPFMGCEPAPPVDLMVLLDASSDMEANLRALAAPLDELRVDLGRQLPDLHVGLATFVDPPAPEGSIGGAPDDWPFRALVAPTDNRGALGAALEELETGFGRAVAEGVTEALAHAAGKPPLPSATLLECEDGREGAACWRPGSWRLALVVTNNHTHEGPGGSRPYGEALAGTVSTWDDTAALMRAQSMRLVVYLLPGGVGVEPDLVSEYATMAADVGGEVADVELGDADDVAGLGRRLRRLLGL